MAIDRRRFLALPAVGIPAMAAKLIPPQVAEPERGWDGGLSMTTADESDDIRYQLDSGRWVAVEECYISISMIGFLAGSRENIRVKRRVIEALPERIEQQFGHHKCVYIKPVPEGVLPKFTFMVFLISTETISDPESDGSKLIVCWLSDNITTSLPELIKRETRAIEWNKYAVDFGY